MTVWSPSAAPCWTDNVLHHYLPTMKHNSLIKSVIIGRKGIGIRLLNIPAVINTQDTWIHVLYTHSLTAQLLCEHILQHWLFKRLIKCKNILYFSAAF